MFYTVKISKADRNQALVLQRRMNAAPKMKVGIWDDRGHKNPLPTDTIRDVIKRPNQLISYTETNITMSMVRFLNFMQKLEFKYEKAKEDRIMDLDLDGNLVFHMNNIDGWHP